MKILEIYTNLEIPRIFILFEQLSKYKLIAWDYIDLLFENEFLETIKTLKEKQNLESLELFFGKIDSKINYILDIIKIFPYSSFINTNFSLINDILYAIMKKTSNDKLNFKIIIDKKEYNFKFIEKNNENIRIKLYLNIYNNKLVITKNSEIMIFNGNKYINIINLIQKNKNLIKNENTFNNVIVNYIQNYLDEKDVTNALKNINKDEMNLNDIKIYNCINLFRNKNDLSKCLLSL